MKRIIWASLAITALLTAGCKSGNPVAVRPAEVTAKKETAIMITIKTSIGNITAELFEKQAPETVKNFCKYIDAGFFNDTIFHRVIPGFMIQGGGFSTAFIQKKNEPPVINEAGNGEKNLRGTLSMARTSDINSGTSQFFINLNDNRSLDHKDNTSSGFGYCVFGKVTEGMDVVDRIAAVKTGSHGPHDDVPLENVVILSIERAGK